MKDYRLRVPIDDPYLHAVGLALICFARLEWDAIYCCEKMDAGYLKTVAKKTAGTIAGDLVTKAVAHSDSAIASTLSLAALEFKRLTVVRNNLIHANPGTAPNGNQRLFRHGAEWTIPMVNDAADEFSENSNLLHHHHHYILK